MLNYAPLSQQQYVDLLVSLIASAEGFRSQVYQLTPNDNTTIGNGYTFIRNNNLAVWQGAGIALTPAEISLLQNIDVAPTRAQQNSLAAQFTHQISPADALNLTSQIYQNYEGPANTLGMPLSEERVALVAITYNRGDAAVNSRMQAFFTAVRNQDRAEAWFELRYNSWGTNPSAEAGLRAARLVESQIFGLYDNPANISADEAKQVYAMLQSHRAKIYADENRWGVNPDGTAGTRNLIAEVNADTRWAAFPSVQTLPQALTPARDAFIAWSNTLLPAGVSALNAADWNPAAIYFGGPAPGFIGPPAGRVLDARPDDGKGGGMAANLLVGDSNHDTLYGGTGNDVLLSREGNDRLVGGPGNDILIGGAGFDTYVWATGDGQDRIEDSDADGVIFVNGQSLVGGIRKAGEAADTYTSSDGQYTYVQSGSTLTINNSITIQNWDPGELGITLRDLSANPTDPGVPTGPFVFTVTLGPGDVNGSLPEGLSGPGAVYGNDLNNILDGSISLNDEFGDLLDGGAGNDSLIGRNGQDYLIGGSGNDYAYVGDGDVFLGGDDADIMAGSTRIINFTQYTIGTGAHYADGGAGDDILLIGQ